MTSTVAIGSVATFSKGSGLAKSDLVPGGPHPCIHYGELFTKYGAVIHAIHSRTNRDLPVKSVKGDVLMPTSDVTPWGLAKASTIQCDGVGLGGDVLVIRPDPARTDPRFLAYAIRHDANQVLSLVRGTTVYHIYAADMRHFEVLMLPIAEQTRIADLLNDADDLVAATERTIAKKQAMKQGMMQQLLTGKTRLPGFTEPWTETTLGSIAVVNMGQSPPGFSYNTARRGMPLIQGNADIKARHTIDRIWTTQPTKRCRAGDVVMTVRAPVGYTAVASRDCCLGRGVCALGPGDSNRFLFHALVYAEPRWAAFEQGSTFTAVNSNQVRSFTIHWPSHAHERRAIAAALDDADAGLAALNNRLAKARDLKQGMMQQLLTGRTRLPVEVAS